MYFCRPIFSHASPLPASSSRAIPFFFSMRRGPSGLFTSIPLFIRERHQTALSSFAPPKRPHRPSALQHFFRSLSSPNRTPVMITPSLPPERFPPSLFSLLTSVRQLPSCFLIALGAPFPPDPHYCPRPPIPDLDFLYSRKMLVVCSFPMLRAVKPISATGMVIADLPFFSRARKILLRTGLPPDPVWEPCDVRTLLLFRYPHDLQVLSDPPSDFSLPEISGR